MGGGRFGGFVEFDVGDFRAADDAFLRLSRESVPRVEIVEIFLNNDITAARKGGVFIANVNGVVAGAAGRVFGTIHETEEIPLVKVAEAVDFVRC